MYIYNEFKLENQHLNENTDFIRKINTYIYNEFTLENQHLSENTTVLKIHVEGVTTPPGKISRFPNGF